LREIYGDNVHTTSLFDFAPTGVPDTLIVEGREYSAAFYGEFTWWVSEIRSISFWRLEDAYEDFKDHPLTGDNLPFDNFPMPVEIGQVFALYIAMQDGSSSMRYYRADGHIWQGRESTQEFTVRE
jgi:hypothetical protein